MSNGMIRTRLAQNSRPIDQRPDGKIVCLALFRPYFVDSALSFCHLPLKFGDLRPSPCSLNYCPTKSMECEWKLHSRRDQSQNLIGQN